jgi:serine/threonine-protein kinase
MGGPDGPKFEPAGEDRGGWHDVALTVTPEGVTAHWDGQAFGMALGSIRQRIQSETRRLRPRYPDDPSIRIVQPDFAPRGGVGLFVMRGSASFRSVSVVPLAGGD